MAQDHDHCTANTSAPDAPQTAITVSTVKIPLAANFVRRLRVAVVYNTKDRAPPPPRQSQLAISTTAQTGATNPSSENIVMSMDDRLAELDTMDTIAAYGDSIGALGHDAELVHGDHDIGNEILRRRREAGGAMAFDIAWNTCEGYTGEGREAQVPAILEMVGLPYTLGKVLCMAVTLDKAMTKRILSFHNLPTPKFQEIFDPEEPFDPHLRYPLFVKPCSEGTGMGITRKSLCKTETEARAMVRTLLSKYKNTVIVEEYISGIDVTCGLVGNIGRDGNTNNIHVFPINCVDYESMKKTVPELFVGEDENELFYHRFFKALTLNEWALKCPAPLPDKLTREIRRLTVETFRVCHCLDTSRVDFRIDSEGNPFILEINAIPGMSKDSDLSLSCYAEGWTLVDLHQEVFKAACARYNLLTEWRVKDPNYP
ncbi:D-alanine--D-alanine ligase [Pelomyxa schiedti]|nr:D-alanine--D-alanine ligase [Pelomyxa schiedti]